MAVRRSDWPKILAGLPRRTLSGRWYRMVAHRYRTAIDSDEGARRVGGRYNPPGIGTLYLGESPEACRAEVARHVQPLPRLVVGTFDVRLQTVCDLTDEPVRKELGVTLDDLTAGNLSATQSLGLAIRAAGFEAILVPSAAGLFPNLVIFKDRLQARSSVRLASTSDAEATPS